jgi:hexosaminidase
MKVSNEKKQPALIPAPANMEIKKGRFTLTPATLLFVSPGVNTEVQYFLNCIKPATGYSLLIKETNLHLPRSKYILFQLDTTLADLGDEGYRLNVAKDKIILSAYRPAGISYGIQTLRQLLPVEIFNKHEMKNAQWIIPCLEIEDKPRFPWRGHLFDCCRHFFPKETVKRTLDLMALHKLNRFHWHLTEDQGWRLEIKRYPNLTKIGAWRREENGKIYGGFYTQEDVKEIVAYAAERHIMVVPEIEMPGHSLGALASYPELGCTGGPYSVANTWGIKKDVYCAGNEKVFCFLENVLEEVLQLFPSPYIHIGGDECPKHRWKECPRCQQRIKTEKLKDEAELQSYFIKRIDKFITAKGRHLIGWDEILDGGLSPHAIVQSWRGTQGGINASKQHHDVIMSPHYNCYLEYTYAYSPLKKIYNYEPLPPEILPELSHHVLGIEGCIWTEHIEDRDRLDFLAYPRLSALSEIGWSPKELKNWADFEARLQSHYKRLDLLKVKYGKDHMQDLLQGSVPIGKWAIEQISASGKALEWDVTKHIKGAGKYCIIPWYLEDEINTHEIKLLENGKVIGKDDHLGVRTAFHIKVDYYIHLKKFNPGAKYTLHALLRPTNGHPAKGEIYLKKME